jgi:hypothetical protein
MANSDGLSGLYGPPLRAPRALDAARRSASTIINQLKLKKALTRPTEEKRVVYL